LQRIIQFVASLVEFESWLIGRSDRRGEQHEQGAKDTDDDHDTDDVMLQDVTNGEHARGSPVDTFET